MNTGMRLFGVAFESVADWSPQRTGRLFAEPAGLYVHVPFCSRLCPFCPYNKVPFQPSLAQEYLAALRVEALGHAALGPFTSLYVGGGTPTLCRAGLGFLADLPVLGERAIEVLPNHMTDRVAGELQELGFTAVSLGVQSFEDAVLRHLGRPNTAAANHRAVAVARREFDCVDVDLIFDVAYDGPDRLLADLTVAFAAGVDQVSTYPLMRFGYTPFGKARHDRRAEHRVLARASELAARHGYRRDSVWTFLRDGSAPYTSITRPRFLGLGAGAASFTGTDFLVNHFGIDQYLAAVRETGSGTSLRAALPGPAAAAYRLFWQAYTGSLAEGPEADAASAAATRLALLLGWAERCDGGGVRLTGRGYDRYHDLERWVTYHLIEPLWEHQMAEHAGGTSTGQDLAARARRMTLPADQQPLPRGDES